MITLTYRNNRPYTRRVSSYGPCESRMTGKREPDGILMPSATMAYSTAGRPRALSYA